MDHDKGKSILMRYNDNKKTVEYLTAELTMLNSQLYGSKVFDQLTSLIYIKDVMTSRLNKAKKEIGLVHKGLKPLGKLHRRLLLDFYIKQHRFKGDELSSKYGAPRATLYREKEKALKEFCENI